MEILEHILGICDDHWHLNIYHIIGFIIICKLLYFKWQKK
jgi:hypothetical protein